MNQADLRNYAPQARRDFIQAVTDRAAYYGVTAAKIEQVTEKGDVAIIGGRAFPVSVVSKRKKLLERINRDGFCQTMEALAYTWFNRFVAIRYMELHGYLEHDYRVLSHPEPSKTIPEILEFAEHIDFPGLSKERVIELKLSGNKESELYHLLLLEQCHALHRAMPFLFEGIDDETELLLPENLLHSDSLIRKMVNEISVEHWRQVEIIGWLYQFYISEKKDEVIGTVVASEDIPAATQLFTPNWIVKYLVQNTLGRQWLATYPESTLRQQMEYYIEPAEQRPEVKDELKKITPTSLNPEELTLLDPACGSGHILVEAYDLFKAIYEERGYRAKDIPALILQKNLFGLEIDDRATQLAAFALMMKARADDRRIFDGDAKPNILAFEDSQEMNGSDITHTLNSPINRGDVPSEYLFEEIQEDKDGLFGKKASAEKGHVSQADVISLLLLFENAKTFGSLIQVPPKLAAKLPDIEKRLDDVLKRGDLTHASAHVIKPLLHQARLLTRQYDAVVANPPYMGTRGMTALLKSFAEEVYPSSNSDLFAMTVERSLLLTSKCGYVAFVTPFVWMFLVSYFEFRSLVLSKSTISSLVQLEYNSFEPACVPVCLFTLSLPLIESFTSQFIRLCEFKGTDLQPLKMKEALVSSSCSWRYQLCNADIKQIPGWPIAYWVSSTLREVFAKSSSVSTVVQTKKGMATGDNDTFVRTWAEVAQSSIGFGMSREEAATCARRWFPYANGGDFRKWMGHHDDVVLWENDGSVLRTAKHSTGRIRATNHNLDVIFKEGLTWSAVSSVRLAVRLLPKGFLFSSVASSLFAENEQYRIYLLGFLNSCVADSVMKLRNPTMHINPGDIASMPIVLDAKLIDKVNPLVKEAIAIATEDWDSCEWSWNFRANPLVPACSDSVPTCNQACESWKEICRDRFRRMRVIEENLNSLFIEAYGLSGELESHVPENDITLYRPDRAEDAKRLLSYSIGCIIGRYSLDRPGLIYADSGNMGFDPSQYKKFRADDDGVIALLETDWGIRDDAATRIVEFMGTAWPKEHLEENLKFIADSLGPTNYEQPRDTIRRYLATGFHKHHLSMYKKRPIYWLFSSGKQRAFQCLVYLHRYHEGTLARMRTEYVIPLQGKIASRIDQLADDIQKATSTSHRKRMEKERDKLLRQKTELHAFDEKLRHYADQRIQLDLDDGVKVNYGKFGDLLAEVRAVTGGSDE